MASHGICDRVAVVGMGCTSFGEHNYFWKARLMEESNGQ
jgi:hypothetical protein